MACVKSRRADEGKKAPRAFNLKEGRRSAVKGGKERSFLSARQKVQDRSVGGGGGVSENECGEKGAEGGAKKGRGI